MRKLNRPALTVFIILGSAFLLAAVGCGESSSKAVAGDVVDVDQNQTGDTNILDGIFSDLEAGQVKRECSNAEFSKLISWRNLLTAANVAVDNSKGKKDLLVIKNAQAATTACYSVAAYHKDQPCRRTKTTVVGTEIKLYEPAVLVRDCQKSYKYLVKYNSVPSMNTDSAVVTPNEPPMNNGGGTVIVDQPQNPNQGSGVPSSGLYRQCSSDEFARLNQYSTAQTKADASINGLGSRANWKYDANAISNSALAIKSCESLIKYHDQNPCQKNVLMVDKFYSGETLRARCQTARTYFYEFVQNTKTLIFPNAELYLDFSPLSPKIFEPGFNNQVSGNCHVENRTQNTIDYSSGQALIVDTRFDLAQVVFETAESLLIQCYGLDIDGPFSKRQVVSVLRAEQSDIRLSYKLK